MDEYPDTESALREFLWRLWLAERRGGHRGRRDGSHPEDV